MAFSIGAQGIHDFLSFQLFSHSIQGQGLFLQMSSHRYPPLQMTYHKTIPHQPFIYSGNVDMEMFLIDQFGFLSNWRMIIRLANHS